MNKNTYLRYKINKKRIQSSFHYAYEQGYFDATIEFEMGKNRMAPILKEPFNKYEVNRNGTNT